MGIFWQKQTKGARISGSKHTMDMQTEVMPVPDNVWLVMSQHIGPASEILVKKGDYVKVGQVVGDNPSSFGVPIHSSVSGTVGTFGELVMPSGARTEVVGIITDKEQAMIDISPPIITDHASFVKAVRDSGMVGLGGAGFPTHVKYNPKNLENVDTLIINAAECEPFLTSDYRTIIEEIDLLLSGTKTVMKHMGITECIIAIEDNKPEAIKVLNERMPNSVRVLKTIYPQGAEKMIIHQAVGKTLPEGMLPADIGVIVSNVTTIAELGRYFETGIPLINKRVTIDGAAVAKPKNVLAPIGAEIKDIVEFCGGYKKEVRKILMGGPMMGLAVYDDSYPLLKNNNGFLFFDNKQTFRYEETACIWCGRCTRACPMLLMPLHLKKANERDDLESLKKYKMGLCIECGSCSYVCPSRQELVQSHRMSKRKLREERERNE